MPSPAVAVLHGSGGDSARYADRLADWLLGVDKIGLRRVLYLRDRDELSAAALRKLQESGTVSVLERRELENYLLDASAITKVLTSLGSSRQDAPTEEQIAKIMLETAEGLKRRIMVNRVCNQVYPTRRLMDHRLRQRLAREGASEEVVRQSVAERLMTEEELQEQIGTAWRIAEADVASRSGSELLHIASGEEILQTIFMRFAQRGYNKREDGVAIAKAMSSPPEEIGTLLKKFMRDEPGTD